MVSALANVGRWVGQGHTVLRPRTLVGRILLVNGLVALVVVAVAMAASFLRDVRDQQQNAAATIDALMATAQPTLASSAVLGDYDTIERLLKRIVAHPLVESIGFTDSDGGVIRHDDAPHASQGHPAWLTRMIAEGTPDREQAVTVGGRPYGILRLEVDDDRIADSLWQRLLDSLLLAVAVLTVGLAAGTIVMRRWLSKLGTLGKLEARIAAGETDATIADMTADTPLEIRQAIEHVNRSASNLRQHFGGRIEALMAALVQHKAALDAAAIVCEVGPDGRLSYVNDLCCEAYMQPRTALLGHPLPGQRSGPQPAEQRAPDGVTRAKVSVQRLADTPLWLQRTIVPIHDVTGALEKYICIDIDVTAMTELQRRLRQLSLAVETTSSAIYITDLQGRIEYVNPGFTELTGFEPTQVVGQPMTGLLAGDTLQSVLDDLWTTLRAGQCWRGRLLNRRKDGQNYWSQQIISVIRDEEGTPIQYVSVCEDISQLVAHQTAMHHLANYDALTGLPNRRCFMQQAQDEVEHGRRTGTRFAAMFLDLDGFKAVNDRFGHEAGDALLIEVSARIQAALRGGDFVGRLGGDEFAVIMVEPPDTTSLGEIARRLIDSLERPVRHQGDDLLVSASIGLALFPDNGDTLETLLRHADLAMYVAKRRGKRQCCFYAADMAERDNRLARLGDDLHHAVARGQFFVEYQPTVATATGAVVAAQALLRWNHPSEGCLDAEQFLSIADDTRQGGPICAWFVDEVCRQISTWQRAGLAPTDVAVGITARQFADPHLPARIDESLAQHGIAASRLVLEVHESVLTSLRNTDSDTLARLAGLGVQIALNGFGQGDGALQALRQHRIGMVRFDRQLIAGLPEAPDDRKMVEGLLRLTHSLGIVAVADGVQSAAQADLLAAWRCTRLQGDHIGPPVGGGGLILQMQVQVQSHAAPEWVRSDSMAL